MDNEKKKKLTKYYYPYGCTQKDYVYAELTQLPK